VTRFAYKLCDAVGPHRHDLGPLTFSYPLPEMAKVLAISAEMVQAWSHGQRGHGREARPFLA
jgi:hypothetical protein